MLAVAPNHRPAIAQTDPVAQETSFSPSTVRALQNSLNKQGIAVAIDGVLGDATRAAIRIYQGQHHLPVTGEPDKGTLDKLGVLALSSVPSDRRTEQTPGAGRMPMKGAGPQGMMGEASGQDTQRGMRGKSGKPMGMMGGDATMSRGRIHDCMGNHMGHLAHLIYGTSGTELTAARVTAMVEGLLAWHGNPRLKLGKVSAENNEILAEIVTPEDSLLQKLAFNRYPGLVRQVP